MKLNLRLFSTIVIAGAVAACDSSSVNVETETADTPTVAAISIDTVTDTASASLLNYTMPAINGGNRRENAVVLIPAGDTPEGGWPVIGWGHGTVGVADNCAPSTSGNLSGYDEYLKIWLESGYAIVAADYEGLGTAGGHPYLHLDSEGRSINYAVSAAAEAFPQLSTNYALLGHSQGGHAVLGAASLTAENPEINLVGTVAMAPASQILDQGEILQGIFTNTAASDEERVATAVGNLGFSALIAHGVKTVFPDFDLDSAFGTDGQALKAMIETTCLSQLSADLATTVPPILLTQNSVESIMPSSLSQDETVLAYFDAVEPGNRELDGPLLLAQGLSDFTVFPNSTIALQSQLSAVSDSDIDPTLQTYQGSDHSGVLLASFNDAEAFIATRFAAAAANQ